MTGWFTKTILYFIVAAPCIVFAQNNYVPANGWAWQQIGIDNSFKKLPGKKTFRVAIIDDAFNLEKNSLANFLDTNKAEIPGNDFDEDGNGKTDDFIGWDFANNDNNVRPPAANTKTDFHGSKVADIFIQTISVILENPAATIRILPIKANSDNSQNNYITDGYKGIEYALNRKVDMIVCCWSFFELKENEQALLARAQKQGVIIVASAGNLLYEQPQYPASFPWSISVAATDRNMHKQAVSNFGQGIDISAPGDSLVAFPTAAKQPPAYISATSAAAPLAAGVIAAISSAFPQLLPQDAEKSIKNSALPIDSLNGTYAGKLGAGMMQVPGIIHYINGGDAAGMYTQPKAYLNLSALAASSQYTIAPYGKYKSIKLRMQPGIKAENDIAIKWVNNDVIKDTVLTPDQLLYPLELKAAKIWVKKNSSRANAIAQPVWWYYEVQTTDSSTLYCSGTTNVEGSEGDIEDGSGAESYTGRCNCKWLIKVPEGKKIQFNFTEMDLEARKDQVFIFNGLLTNAPILAIFSGQKIPPVVTSWGNRTLVWFISNETNHGKGWKLHYKAVD